MRRILARYAFLAITRWMRAFERFCLILRVCVSHPLFVSGENQITMRWHMSSMLIRIIGTVDSSTSSDEFTTVMKL